jgi:DNA polymerase III gamma/tau subunit
MVKYPPTIGKYKVYIIDEVHMLSTAAENAFLKTLEEPPEHAIFILATTDPQKVRQTIRSRCMQLNFKRVTEDELIEVTPKSIRLRKTILDMAQRKRMQAAKRAALKK